MFAKEGLMKEVGKNPHGMDKIEPPRTHATKTHPHRHVETPRVADGDVARAPPAHPRVHAQQYAHPL